VLPVIDKKRKTNSKGLCGKQRSASRQSVSGGMVEQAIECRVVVNSPSGLHMRPADMVARLANQFQSKVEVVRLGQVVDGKSILGLLTLGATEGTELLLRATGPDAQQAVGMLADLFEQGFFEAE
jgi:phosphocarrier protein HPr